MYLCCEVCQKPLSKDNPSGHIKDGICCKKCEHAYPYFRDLSKRFAKLSSEHDTLFHEVEIMIDEASEQLLTDSPNITVSLQRLKNLTEFIKTNSIAVETYWKTFLVKQMLVSTAMSLFTSKRKYGSNRGSRTNKQMLTDKLCALYKFCSDLSKVKQYPNLDMTPPIIIKELKRWW